MIRPVINGTNSVEPQHQIAEQRFWRRQIREARILNGVTLLAALVGIITLLVVRQSLIDNENATFEANRALLTPLGMATDFPVLANTDLQIKVYYADTGRSAASNFKSWFRLDDVVDNDPTHLIPLSGGYDDACGGALLATSSSVSYVDTQGHWLGLTIPASLISTDVVSGHKAVILHGCFIYDTLGESKTTIFCYVAVRNAQPASQVATTQCSDGQYTN